MKVLKARFRRFGHNLPRGFGRTSATETTSEPIVYKSPGSNTADAYAQLARNFHKHIAGKKDIGDMDVVFEESWFPDEDGGTHEQASQNLKGSWLDDEPDEKSGRFGIF